METTGRFSGEQGVEIFYRHQPADTPRAGLVLVHGLGEHSGRYRQVIERLNILGLSVWALDLRGHGKSGGTRGHTAAFDHYLADVDRTIDLALEGSPGWDKVFLLGHSLGGLIVLTFALNRPERLRGAIASSPALAPAIRIPGGKKLAGNVMSVIWPGLTMGNEIDARNISRYEDTVRAYQADPLVHDRVSARFFTEFMGAMEKTSAGAARMAVPTLLQVAGADRLVDAKQTKAFFERLTVPDKTLQVYDGLFHEIYNERPDDREKVLADLQTWLQARL